MRATAMLLLVCACIAAFFASAWSRSNNLLLGRVQAAAGKHAVVVLVDHGVVSVGAAMSD